ncbi:threonine-phosphate decarboxylase [Aliikangiella coralliicola]|uniref:Aminotransferase n=1 Tax=Aliikangiella coralliicola TaxID=2592383 RepID=A0A545UJI3_9GAMM|nr:threonine-phosphate decarboxylase [Aliikangiella coralliicola]TQV89627.1 pyridoxal phosphate-dependent class II aminotransferase [Aliikangiella coralliicola]
MSLTHGGQLNSVAEQFDLDTEGWLDLSTGISPFSYPVSDIPQSIWRELPVPSANLIQQATNYYSGNNLLSISGLNENIHTSRLMVTNGSQSVIQSLPMVKRKNISSNSDASTIQVFVPEVGYKEHEKAWRDQGFKVVHYRKLPQPEQLTRNCVVVVINPNNPGGEKFAVDSLIALATNLSELGGWLVIDEAFMDVFSHQCSMITEVMKQESSLSDCVIVLRSVGKFFGLAGIRIGFVCTTEDILEQLRDMLGPWQVNGPALLIAEKALGDLEWQRRQRERLSIQRSKLQALLTVQFELDEIVGTDLFLTVKTNSAEQWFERLCRHKVYVRLCDEKNAIRFGIPDDTGLERLQLVFEKISQAYPEEQKPQSIQGRDQ